MGNDPLLVPSLLCDPGRIHGRRPGQSVLVQADEFVSVKAILMEPPMEPSSQSSQPYISWSKWRPEGEEERTVWGRSNSVRDGDRLTA
ncbi:hypothetical protein NDU88_012990 [Pleurodeles waltl]|uniref:Uncharacterized protein n=1 Tax=Pleurodeles waltl TaxID=8319 RepID=A0AAV7R1Q5_PLEWA|nr:hypothetical protein NDU88_012990 [Pleurodeles waltl]